MYSTAPAALHALRVTLSVATVHPLDTIELATQLQPLVDAVTEEAFMAEQAVTDKQVGGWAGTNNSNKILISMQHTVYNFIF